MGSYELLVWIIRTAAAGGLDRVPAADHGSWHADHPGADQAPGGVGMHDTGQEDRLTKIGLAPEMTDGPQLLARAGGADQVCGPGNGPADHPDQGRSGSRHVSDVRDENETKAAAVAAYLSSLAAGRPLSERKLAGMFGKTSRRWARSRMAEARQTPMTA